MMACIVFICVCVYIIRQTDRAQSSDQPPRVHVLVPCSVPSTVKFAYIFSSVFLSSQVYFFFSSSLHSLSHSLAHLEHSFSLLLAFTCGFTFAFTSFTFTFTFAFSFFILTLSCALSRHHKTCLI